LRRWHRSAETVLLNHVLHLFTYDDADQVLDECAKCLEPRGTLIVVDADIIDVIFSWRIGSYFAPEMQDLVSDDVEPTDEGKILRWATWHGSRRSMWSGESVVERLHRRGLLASEILETSTWSVASASESFVVIGVR